MKCIIKNEDKFEIISVKEIENIPLNTALYFKSRAFEFVENGIKVTWGGDNFKDIINFFYDEFIFIKLENVQIQSVCDYMNKFMLMNKFEIKELVDEAKNKKKTELEVEIEKLTQIRASIYNEIKQLKLMINSL